MSPNFMKKICYSYLINEGPFRKMYPLAYVININKKLSFLLGRCRLKYILLYIFK